MPPALVNARELVLNTFGLGAVSFSAQVAMSGEVSAYLFRFTASNFVDFFANLSF